MAHDNDNGDDNDGDDDDDDDDDDDLMITLGSFWHHFESTFTSFWDGFGMVLGSF